MGGSISIVQLVISVLIFVVLFFGIGFLLNMLLRVTWLMAYFYPIVVILIIDQVKFMDYFLKPGSAFPQLWERLTNLQSSDIIILASGLVGAIISGIVIKLLRKNGYQMF